MKEGLIKMNRSPHPLCMNQSIAYTRVAGAANWAAKRKRRAGTICSSCNNPLPQPHKPGLKRCTECAGRHLVHLSFVHSGAWHCFFRSDVQRVPLPRQLIFRDAAKIYEIARRGNGLSDDSARRWLDCCIRIGRGNILLRLSNEQYRAVRDLG